MANQDELYGMKIPELIDYAWKNLIWLPPVKDQGSRNERKRLLIELILKGRVTDITRLPIPELADVYVYYIILT